MAEVEDVKETPEVDNAISDTTVREEEVNEPVVEVEGEAESTETPVEKRIGQIWARAKKAETENKTLREERAALEAEVRVRKEIQTKPEGKSEKIYTWAELEPFIESGQMTRAQASDYRESILLKKATETAKAESSAESEAQTRMAKVDSELGRFTKSIPGLKDKSSEAYRSASEAYSELVYLHGAPKDKAQELKYELTACRQAFGNVDAIEKRGKALDDTRANRETYMETSSGNRPVKNVVKEDAPKDLSPRELDFYKNGIQKGQYKGWAEVHEEIAFYKKKKGIK